MAPPSNSGISLTSQPLAATLPIPPQMGGIMTPSRPGQTPSARLNHGLSKDAWGDFDPLA